MGRKRVRVRVRERVRVRVIKKVRVRVIKSVRVRVNTHFGTGGGITDKCPKFKSKSTQKSKCTV